MEESEKQREPLVLDGRFKINSIRCRSRRFVLYNGFDSLKDRPVITLPTGRVVSANLREQKAYRPDPGEIVDLLKTLRTLMNCC